MTQLMDPARLKPINLCTAYQPQTSKLVCRKIHYTIQPANNYGADQIEWYDLHLHSWHIAKTGVGDTDTYIIWYIRYVHYGV